MKTSYKIELLRAMNAIALTANNEDYIYEMWFYVMPDGADEDDFKDIAEDDEMFDDVCRAFKRIIETLNRDGMFVNGRLY